MILLVWVRGGLPVNYTLLTNFPPCHNIVWNGLPTFSTIQFKNVFLLSRYHFLLCSIYVSTHLNYLIFLSDFNLHNGWCITLRKYVLQEFAILANFFYCLSLTSCSLGKLPLCSGVTVYLMYSYEQKFVIAENIWSERLAKKQC